MKQLIHLFLIIFLITGICSCRTQYVPVETVKYKYRYIEKLKYDSIYKLDSIYIDRSGDTIRITKFKYLYKYMFVNKIDSFIQRDSVQVPYPVERQLTRWQSLKMELGGLAMGGLIFALIIVGWLVYRSQKK